MTRPLMFAALAVLMASCTKPRIEPTTEAERARLAKVEEESARAEAAPRTAADDGPVAEREAPAASKPVALPEPPQHRGGWSVGTPREDAAGQAGEGGDAQSSDDDQVEAHPSDDDDEGEAREGVAGQPRYDESGEPVQANAQPVPSADTSATGTMADTATAATGAAAGTRVAMQNTRISRGRGDGLPPVEDAQAYDEEGDGLPHATSGDPSCGPGEVALGYDPAADEAGLCVPRTLADQCQRQGQLPVVVSDLGMDCAMQRDGGDGEEEALAAAAPIDLPSCDEESVIVLLPDAGDEGGSAFDCRLVAQLDQSTMRGLTGKSCDDQAVVVKVYAGSSTDDAIKGDVSCL